MHRGVSWLGSSDEIGLFKKTTSGYDFSLTNVVFLSYKENRQEGKTMDTTPFTPELLQSIADAGASRIESMGRAHRAGTNQYLYSVRIRDLSLDATMEIVRRSVSTDHRLYGYSGANGSTVVAIQVEHMRPEPSMA